MNSSLKPTILHIQGRLILAEGARLVGYMTKICAQPDKTVLLDLGGIERIDTCGVAVLLACDRRIRSAGGTLTICASSDTVNQMFSVCNVSDLLLSNEEHSAAERRKA